MEQPGDARNKAIKEIAEKYKDDPEGYKIAMSRVWDHNRRVWFIPECPAGHRMIGGAAQPMRGGRPGRGRKNPSKSFHEQRLDLIANGPKTHN